LDAERQISSLKIELGKSSKEVEEERARAEKLQEEIDSIQRTIWLRKYDAASPRSPRASFMHDREADPHAEAIPGLYAGQVGFEAMAN